MMIVLLAIISIPCIFAGGDDECPKGPCNEGYYDKTNGQSKWWACGRDCPGGIYRTDGYCNCACLPLDECEAGKCDLNRGPCNEGYVDTTEGNFNWWACGANCVGGKYYTDGVCNCACEEKPDNCDDGVVCHDQGPCKPGYMDKTDGNYKWWACGRDCPGGMYFTDGVCNCACIDAGQCSIVPSYHNFNLYRAIPELSFIRTFGVFGEYLAISIIIISLALCSFMCYKKKIKMAGKSNKYKVVSFDESSSEVENVPINQ